MDMIERRIRDAVATLLSRSAQALERTAGELEQAAGELRRREPDGDAERVWSEPDREPDTVIRGAPLRAVPDTPTDAPARPKVPPVKPPQAPDVGNGGHVTADAGTSPVADPGLLDARDATPTPEVGDDAGAENADVIPAGEELDADVSAAERLRAMATGTVSEIRAQLDGLTDSDLRTLRQIEVANRNRTTLLTAIDRALDTDG